MNKRVTIKDVAKAANVSIATVSYVINGVGSIADETRKKILEIIDEMGYKPDLNARSLVKKQSRVIGLLIPVNKKIKKTLLMNNPFYIEFFISLQYRAIEYGYSILLIDTEEKEEVVTLINNGTLLGVIVLGIVPDYIYKSLEESNLPIVVIDQDKRSDRYMYIVTDDRKASYMAVEYLIKKGHRNIAFLSGEIDISRVHVMRFEGYKKALKDYNIPLKEKYIIQEHVSHEGGIKSAEIVKKLIPEVTAIFSISDIMAMGLIKGLFNQNIYVPEHISVMGFDNIKIGQYFIPELTTMDQNIALKAELAIDMIVDSVNKSDNIGQGVILPVKLIEGNSVKEK